jgi:hypothetical protein
VSITNDDLLEAGESLLVQMTAQATGGQADAAEYARARDLLVRSPTTTKLVPRFVRICRNPSQFWGFIKEQADTYAGRRTFLAEQFDPILSALERVNETPLDALVAEVAERLGSAGVRTAWMKAMERRQSDPEGAITAARSLLESVCKTILEDAGVAYGHGEDLPKLYRKVATELNLAPSDHTEQQFKRILGGCQSVVEGLGSLRNRASDAHGAGRTAARPAARHAGLAVSLAGGMALFLIETSEFREQQTEV